MQFLQHSKRPFVQSKRQFTFAGSNVISISSSRLVNGNYLLVYIKAVSGRLSATLPSRHPNGHFLCLNRYIQDMIVTKQH